MAVSASHELIVEAYRMLLAPDSLIEVHRVTAIAYSAIIAFEIGGLCLVLHLSPLISKHIGAIGIYTFTRIMDLIRAALAVEFITNGLKRLSPALA